LQFPRYLTVKEPRGDHPRTIRSLGFKPRRLRSSKPLTADRIRRREVLKMFLGSIPRRPSKEAAYKQLKTHLAMMASCVVVIRAAPYILHFLTRDGDSPDLKLEI
jgi:hypothetical protein